MAMTVSKVPSQACLGQGSLACKHIEDGREGKDEIMKYVPTYQTTYL